MAFIQTIRSFIFPGIYSPAASVTPAPIVEYKIKPLTIDHLKEVIRLNLRCFSNGDNYTRYTFEYLFNEPRTLSYRIAAPSGNTLAFAFAMTNDNGAGHLTTIGVAPEHRRRGLAAMLLQHMERSLVERGLYTLMLEVRLSNIEAQNLYKKLGYTVVQRINGYYNNGEDCLLMIKALN